MSVHHSFDIDLASQYGIEEAILIHHFQHWIRHNKALNRNFHEGRYWTYQTLDEIEAHFPYLSKESVRAALHRLCTGKGRRSKKDDVDFEPVLIKGNFNRTPFDKTVWYAFSNSFYERETSQMEKGGLPDPNGQPPTPIPHTITNTKTYEEHPPTPPEGGKATKVALDGFGSHIKLKKEDYENFCDEYGKTNVDQLFEEINDWISSGRGKAYKDYAAGIRTWIRRRDWKRIEKSTIDFIQPKPQPKKTKERAEINLEWLESFLLQDEFKKKLYRECRANMKERFVDFIDLPEGKIYYDQESPVFQACVQSAIMKLKR